MNGSVRGGQREGSGWGAMSIQALQQHKGRQYRADPSDPGSGRLIERVHAILGEAAAPGASRANPYRK